MPSNKNISVLGATDLPLLNSKDWYDSVVGEFISEALTKVYGDIEKKLELNLYSDSFIKRAKKKNQIPKKRAEMYRQIGQILKEDTYIALSDLTTKIYNRAVAELDWQDSPDVDWATSPVIHRAGDVPIFDLRPGDVVWTNHQYLKPYELDITTVPFEYCFKYPQYEVRPHPIARAASFQLVEVLKDSLRRKFYILLRDIKGYLCGLQIDYYYDETLKDYDLYVDPEDYDSDGEPVYPDSPLLIFQYNPVTGKQGVDPLSYYAQKCIEEQEESAYEAECEDEYDYDEDSVGDYDEDEEEEGSDEEEEPINPL